MASTEQPIVLYHYLGSPYSDRVTSWLALKNIPYYECVQPPMLPRPDLTSLGIKHRRIPILSIGRDVYLDSRLILDKLTALRPPPLSAPEHSAIEHLLRAWTTDLFFSASMLLPLDNPLVNNPAFQRDRAELIGREGVFGRDTRAAARPESIVTMTRLFEFLENTLLKDGRDWVLGNPEPTMADLEAVWLLRWITAMPGSLEGTGLDQGSFPKVFAWTNRFQGALKAKQSAKPEAVSGEKAGSIIAEAGYNDAEGEVDETDPVAQAQGLKKGQLVQLWPSDYGSAHKDQGTLIGFNDREVTIETTTAGGATVRLHAPRQGFRVAPVNKTKI